MRVTKQQRLIGNILVSLYEYRDRLREDFDESDEDTEEDGSRRETTEFHRESLTEQIDGIKAGVLGIAVPLVDIERYYIVHDGVTRHEPGCRCGRCDPDDSYRSFRAAVVPLALLSAWAGEKPDPITTFWAARQKDAVAMAHNWVEEHGIRLVDQGTSFWEED